MQNCLILGLRRRGHDGKRGQSGIKTGICIRHTAWGEAERRPACWEWEESEMDGARDACQWAPRG